ncbi:DNA polymerase III sliding clamp [Gordonia phage Horus]|uniref:DNA polymerase III sliding clamp n=1 Tax=Gordonia phage Horus TaxID=2301696 RepID=A0A385DZJ4_9CAUD|nr:RusA-like Holliday junction resolvase [Gordonia phage Horus]AXQ63909.1 DNA polymerase III sliding clamp [Gordonia phage Horus]
MTKNTTTATPRKPATKRASKRVAKPEPRPIGIHVRELERAIARVKPFAHADELLPVINSIIFDYRDGVLSAFATDRFTMGCNIVEHTADADNLPENFTVVVRLGELPLLLAAVKRGSAGGHAVIAHRDGQIVTDGVAVGDPTLVEAVPKWRNILAGAVREAGAPEINSAISMNPVYLRRFAQIKPTPTMSVSTAGKPIVVTSVNFIGLLMPVRDVDGPDRLLERLGIELPASSGEAAA